VLKRYCNKAPEKAGLFGTALPSGTSPLGTFGEVARRAMIRAAFSALIRAHSDAVGCRFGRAGRDAQSARSAGPEPLADICKTLTSVPILLARRTSFAHKHAMLAAGSDTFRVEYDSFGHRIYGSARFEEELALRAARSYGFMGS